MHESKKTFIRTRSNKALFEKLDEISAGKEPPSRLFVQGPKGTGKSTLLRGIANDAELIDPSVFVCSGADIAVALSIKTDPHFLDKIGSVPSLYIDDITPLGAVEDGDQLLSLLIKERDRLHLNTVVVSDVSLEECGTPKAAEYLQNFDMLRIEPLDSEDQAEFARRIEAEYSIENSPKLDDEAIKEIIDAMKGNLADVEKAIRYLVTDADCCQEKEINAERASELLTLSDAAD